MTRGFYSRTPEAHLRIPPFFTPTWECFLYGCYYYNGYLPLFVLLGRPSFLMFYGIGRFSFFSMFYGIGGFSSFTMVYGIGRFSSFLMFYGTGRFSSFLMLYGMGRFSSFTILYGIGRLSSFTMFYGIGRHSFNNPKPLFLLMDLLPFPLWDWKWVLFFGLKFGYVVGGREVGL